MRSLEWAQILVTPRVSDRPCSGHISNVCTNPVASECLRSPMLGHMPRGSTGLITRVKFTGPAGDGDSRNQATCAPTAPGLSCSCLSSIYSDHCPSCCFVAPFPRPIPSMLVTFRSSLTPSFLCTCFSYALSSLPIAVIITHKLITAQNHMSTQQSLLSFTTSCP